MSTQKFPDILDQALIRMKAGESIEDIRRSYPDYIQELEPLLTVAGCVQSLEPVEMPSPDHMRAERERFLSEVAGLKAQSAQPVSLGLVVRLKGWMEGLSGPNPQPNYRRQRQMMGLMLKGALAFILAFGLIGSTVVLADNSLPGTALYPIKLATEDVQIRMVSDPDQLATLYLNQASERSDELVQMTLAGKTPDQMTVARLEDSLTQALNMASQLSNGELVDWLGQAQQMTQAQEQALNQVQAGTEAPIQEPLRQAEMFINQAQVQVQYGLTDPQGWRHRHSGAGSEPEPTLEPTEPVLVEDPVEPVDPVDPVQTEPAAALPGKCEGDGCESNRNQVQNQRGQTDPPEANCEGAECDPTQSQVQNHDVVTPTANCQGEECQPQNQHQHRNQEQHEATVTPQPTPGGDPIQSGLGGQSRRNQNQEIHGQESGGSGGPSDNGNGNSDDHGGGNGGGGENGGDNGGGNGTNGGGNGGH